MSEPEAVDPFDARLALGVEGTAADLQPGRRALDLGRPRRARLARLERRPTTRSSRLGAAFAARAPRLGNVCVDLATIHATADADTEVPADLGALPVARPGHVAPTAGGQPPGRGRPPAAPGGNDPVPRPTLGRRVPRGGRAPGAVRSTSPPAWTATCSRQGWRSSVPAETTRTQRMAAATAVLRQALGHRRRPGTGKTTTVARVLALLEAQAVAAGERPPLVALAAPTGKAAARLEDAVRQGADAMAVDHDRSRIDCSALGGLDRAPAPRLQPGQPHPLPAPSTEPAAP